VLIALSSVSSGRTAQAPAHVPLQIVLVSAQRPGAERIAAWKQDGFKAVAVVLDDATDERVCREVFREVTAAALDVYYWIEVGRNPKLADAHPRWMASLGMHQDWRKRFPGVRAPKEGEVAKAYPWVPVWYQEAFDAQLARVERLLKKVPAGYRGLLLNDLQGAPGSCGCGNRLCRWATDYQVPATGTRIVGDDAPARFINAVRQRVRDKQVMPVWVTECEEQDLPADKRADGKTTGLCGDVGCAVGLCPKEFSKQWSALVGTNQSPVGLLGLSSELERDRAEPGSGRWVTNAVAYLDQVLPKNGARRFPRGRLWLVVRGADAAHEAEARRLAVEQNPGAIVVARIPIDQSYEPRIIAVKE
jgi:hypothetical protein